MPNNQEIQEHTASLLAAAKIRKQSVESGRGSLEIEATYALEALWFLQNQFRFPEEVKPYLFTYIPMEDN